MIVFKVANHPNYGKEAVKLLLQEKHIFSKRMSMQLVWLRFLNTKVKLDATFCGTSIWST